VSGKLKVLVTGATGKQGGHLVGELLARHGLDLVGVDPDRDAAFANLLDDGHGP